jgi:magnesium transporter
MSAIDESSAAISVRAAYRSGDGHVHLNWPAERVGEAVADRAGVLWLDVQGLAPNLGSVERLFQEVFHFHRLAIDDALKEKNAPKLDDWGEYLGLVFHTVDFNPVTDALQLHELDAFLGPNYLVSYHIESLPAIDRLRQLLERDSGQRLAQRPDLLLYHVLDLGVADYLPAFEHLDEAIDDAQNEVFTAPTPRTLRKIFQIKRAALRLHRAMIPLREILNRLARDEYPLIDAHNRVYFRDVYDQLVRIHDISETVRDLISGALDIYLSAISNRTNEVMKTLTIITVVFLPLSFVQGFFGMNFFAENLALRSSLPRTFLFWLTCLMMVLTPPVMWAWAHGRWLGRRWFGKLRRRGRG